MKSSAMTFLLLIILPIGLTAFTLRVFSREIIWELSDFALADGRLTVKVSNQQNHYATLPALFFGAYDDDDRLLWSGLREIERQVMAYSCPLPKGVNAAYYRAFLWEAASNARPLADSLMLPATSPPGLYHFK